MKILAVLLMLALALPVAAQQSRVCNGKQSFSLSDGTQGCLLGVEANAITSSSTLTVGNTRSTTNSNWDAAIVDVAVFGEKHPSKPMRVPLVRQICAIFKEKVQQEMRDEKYKYIIIRLHWPNVPRPAFKMQRALDEARLRGQKASSVPRYIVEAGYTNRRCGSARRFSRY